MTSGTLTLNSSALEQPLVSGGPANAPWASSCILNSGYAPLCAYEPRSVPRLPFFDTVCRGALVGESDMIPVMSCRKDAIAIATRHVEEGRRIVTQQRKLISEGLAVPNAVELLRTFEQSLKIFEADLERLLRERDGNEQSCGPA